MQLTDEQKKEVAAWIAAGAKLSEVQQRLGEEFGIRLTYMEARFLVDDLALVPQDKEVKKEEPKKEAEPLAGEEAGLAEDGDEAADDADALPPAGGAGNVSLTLDAIVKPGALVSGKVTFSDGIVADWYIDQMGRFGLVPPDKGYRPSQEDLMAFRVQLERELARQGM